MEQKLYYSCISGYGVYERLNGEDTFPGIGRCCQMRHIETGIEYYALLEPCSDAAKTRLCRLIESRIPDPKYIWPCDLAENSEGERFLLFSPDVYPQYITLLDTANGKRGYEDPAVMQTLFWVLERMDRLWTAGYVTADFDLSNYYFDPTREDGYISFSVLTARKIGNAPDRKGYSVSPVSRIAKSRGLVDPHGFTEEHERYTWNDDSFLIAVASLVFYLMIGRMPYDGALQDDDRYDMELNPERFWGHSYSYRPFFIMDPADGVQNSVGEYPEELVQIERYNRLSEKLKEMFCHSLRNENVMRENVVTFYTPREWKQEILAWYDIYRSYGGGY